MIDYTILFHPEAEKEFISAYLWYEKQLEGLGERFINAVEKQIQYISNNPESYQLKKRGCRESKTAIFPYLIVFRVYKPKREILVVAIYHTGVKSSVKVHVDCHPERSRRAVKVGFDSAQPDRADKKVLCFGFLSYTDLML
ncbi:type II toxin-antitoxin system RelE/ParE family toxin [Pedobacter endophyticus]|uniref:Type II toxin-antitoxin system RelE/ParE family toxin n=1 Tax=Pedobacter endophyticus TaxID=2789740 RepID=A0A7U3SPS9_9SPHI|nr:type II toxin-antitoxin system RelE/ParE family toxin [Pedobacter endophyticus]QPH38224.1 type II toxin-antitoxin system RelE/ParE family toxin [Pedobacter endophyticus]